MPRTAHEQADKLVFETARLRLRALTMSDLPIVIALAGDPRVAEQTARIPHPLTPAAAEAWLEAAIDAESRETAFAVERKHDEEFLGVVGLLFADEEVAELGFWLGRRYWNRGYMTEAVRRVLAYAFAQRAVATVRACTFLGNTASARVQEKVGMRPIGSELRQAPARGCCRRESELRELRRQDWRG